MKQRRVNESDENTKRHKTIHYIFFTVILDGAPTVKIGVNALVFTHNDLQLAE